MTNSVTPTPSMNKKINHPRYWYFDLLLIIILAAGGYLRFVGISWDEDQHLHPDERFLTTVEVDMHPVETISDYFNTATSTLNPHNVGHSFYVYGDFPVIFTRYMANWVGLVNAQGSAEYGTIHVLGRQISASFDLLTILMIFLIGRKLYDRRIGLLASGCYSLTAIPIQLSHFFAVDTFAGFFISVAVYAAVSIYQQYLQNDQQERDSDLEAPVKTSTWSGIGYYLLFGFGLGMAMSCKISTAPLAIVLPAAVAGWYLRQNNQKQANWFFPLLQNMVIAAAFAFLVFRIFQPYAFTGPGFFGIKPNEKFISNLQEVSGQSKGEVDFPPALQWARRPITFAFTNLTIWGTGLPLGILGWIGVLWMAYRFLKKDWEQHLAIWIWTVAYFGYQSISFNPMMRYTFLIYPTFCLIAAWVVFYLWDHTRLRPETGETYQPIWSRGEVYSALQMGVVDGAENNVTALTNGRHGEVCKFYSETEHQIVPDVLVMSVTRWDSLKKPQQEIIKKAAIDSFEYQKSLWGAFEKVEREKSLAMGVKFNTPNKQAFVAKVKPMMDEERKNPAIAKLLDSIAAVK